MTHSRKEILWINTLKGGCILLVVLHHAIITTFAPSLHHLTAGLLPAQGWVAFNTWLSPLRMPAFFFVSGLLAANAVVKKSWQEVFTKKIQQYCLPLPAVGRDSVAEYPLHFHPFRRTAVQ